MNILPVLWFLVCALVQTSVCYYAIPTYICYGFCNMPNQFVATQFFELSLSNKYSKYLHKLLLLPVNTNLFGKTKTAMYINWSTFKLFCNSRNNLFLSLCVCVAHDFKQNLWCDGSDDATEYVKSVTQNADRTILHSN